MVEAAETASAAVEAVAEIVAEEVAADTSAVEEVVGTAVAVEEERHQVAGSPARQLGKKLQRLASPDYYMCPSSWTARAILSDPVAST